MLALKEVKQVKTIPSKGPFILVADSGGTNSTFALATIKKEKPVLLVTFHGKSKEIKNVPKVIDELVKHIQHKYAIKLKHACFAIAGVVSPEKDFGRLTNLPLEFDADAIKKKTHLKTVLIINDFEANGYAIDVLPKKSIKTIKAQKNVPQHNNKIMLGAGTGFGKSILIWNNTLKQHIPSASEGGHADLVIHTEEELKMAAFIKKLTKIPKKVPLEWEDLLSGSGLQNIYRYLGTIKKYRPTTYQQELKKHDLYPYLISRYRKKDICCRDTFSFFTKFYARCAKNFALDSLSLAGIYFSGGIAAGNPDIFEQRIFWNEFLNTRKQAQLLKQIPIYVVTDTNIGLYGATIFAMLCNNTQVAIL